MAEEKQKAKKKTRETEKAYKLRGRTFKGTVIKKFVGRVSIELERTVYIRKYERYAKKKTKLHAKLPRELEEKVKVGDYIEIRECRPISKMIHFVVIKKIKGKEENKTV